MESAILSPSQIRYLREVLGVEQILWKSPSDALASAPRVAVFVDKLNNSDRNVLTKMLSAMMLKSTDFEVFESPNPDEYLKILDRAPILALIFGQHLADEFGVDFSHGKFVNLKGVATVITYGPADFSTNPELKAEA